MYSNFMHGQFVYRCLETSLNTKLFLSKENGQFVLTN